MAARISKDVPLVVTIGHSTRSVEDFLEILKAHGVKCVVDVRTIPRSRHNPQFNKETLPAELRRKRIGYRHMPGLGGLRKPRPDSPNTAWRNASFRGFADYMQTDDFAQNLACLIELANKKQIAIMCAESVPWRCHRSLIADALQAQGIRVEHVTGLGARRAHKRTPWARVRKGRVTYPASALAGAGA